MNNRGFTLPELLLSAVILIFVLSGLLMLFANCIVLNDASRSISIATSHAQYILEDLRRTPFSSLASSISAGAWNWDTQEITAAGLIPLREETILTYSSGTNPLQVTVSVLWKDRRARDTIVELITRITNYQ